MERLNQMHAIPDVLPVLQPTIDLCVVFPEAPPEDVVQDSKRKSREEYRADRGRHLLWERAGIYVF